MCSGTKLLAWQARCVENLLAIDGAELTLLIVPETPPVTAGSRWQKLKHLHRWRGRLWSHYNRHVDARAAAKRPVDLSSALSAIPQLKCRVLKKGKFSEFFTEPDIANIRAYRLDFILRFSFNIIRGDILSAAKYGVWSFHHGEIGKYRGGPPCFWEIYFGEPMTGVTLQRLNERLDGGVVLRIETFPTVHTSYMRNRDAAHFLGVTWPADLCRGLLERQCGRLSGPPTTSAAPIYRLPTNREMIVFCLRCLKNRLSRVRWRAKHVDRTAAQGYKEA